MLHWYIIVNDVTTQSFSRHALNIYIIRYLYNELVCQVREDSRLEIYYEEI